MNLKEKISLHERTIKKYKEELIELENFEQGEIYIKIPFSVLQAIICRKREIEDLLKSLESRLDELNGSEQI